jgi:hypothetical protein
MGFLYPIGRRNATFIGNRQIGFSGLFSRLYYDKLGAAGGLP